jgi:lipase
VTLHAHAFGPVGGAPLVALHGVRGFGGRWQRLAALGRRVHGFDLRGHGESPDVAPWTLEQHASDVLSTMDVLGLSTVDLLGHSFGGCVAVYVARTAPERVRRLVLLDPAVGISRRAARDEAAKSLVLPSFGGVEEARADRAARWPDAQPSFVDDELTGNLVRDDADGRWRPRWRPTVVVTAYSEMARPAVAPPKEVPTLVLRSVSAGVVRPGFLEACARDGDVRVVDVDCGHMVLEARPEETLRHVGEFLA